jgi:large subunit ribosomal protein L10
MNRQQKDNVVQDLSQKFTSNQAAFVVKCQGLTVGEMHQLRMNLSTVGGELKVAKNRLVKLAINDNAECINLGSLMKGQTAVVFVKSNFTAAAKVLNDFAKKHDALQIVAGCCESQMFDKQGVISLSKIPSREVLLARLCGVLQAPVVKTAWIISEVVKKKSGDVVTQQ